MSVTMFGGSDTSYTEVGGIPQPGVNGQVYATATGADRILGAGGLMASDGVTPSDVVTADSDGFYVFGVDNHPGDVYLDFGRGRKRVHPADVGNRISTLEATVAGLGSGGGATLTDGSAWQANHAYAAGAVFVKADGSYRAVKAAYTSGATYLTADDTASTPTSPPPPTSAAIVAAVTASGSFAPSSGAYRQVAFRTGALLTPGLELDGSGIDMPAAGTWNQIVCVTDFYSAGQDIIVGLWKLDSANSEVLVLKVPITAGKIGSIWNVQRTDAASGASGQPVVTDASITIYDKGRAVTGTGIPANTYIGQTVSAGTNFRLSSSATTQVDVNLTAALAGNIVVGAAISHAKDDQVFARIIQGGTTFAGQGLKMRLMLGTEVARVNVTPGVPTGLSVIATTATSVTLQWTPGANSSQHVLERDGKPIARVGGIYTFTDSGLGSADVAGHDYAVRAQRGNAISAATATVHGTPTATYTIVPQAAAGAMDGTKSTVTLATNPGASVVFNNGGADLTTTSGNVGNFAAADRDWIQFVADTGSYTAWETKGMFKMGITADAFDIYLSANAGLPSGMTNGLKFFIGAFNWKCEFFAPTFGSAQGGTGAAGTSQLLTSNTYPIVSSSVVAAGGSPAWASSLVAGTVYGYKVRQTNNSDGTQTCVLYLGSSTQYGTDGSGLPVIATITLNAAMKTALQPGHLFYEQESGSTTGVSQSTNWTAMLHTPVAA